MKSKKSTRALNYSKEKAIFAILIISIFVISIPIISKFTKEVYAGDLQFDDNGNLTYTVKNVKDSSGVAYRSIGWVLKRYNMPIDAPGQQYVIIRKGSSSVLYPDPNNSSIMLSTFVSTSTEILNAIEKKSSKWKKQVVDYGGKIYIDSVMTVVVNGTPQGSVSSDGKCTGEYYLTYDGISKARAWGKPTDLLQYYDLAVDYKPKKKEINPEYNDETAKTEKKSSEIVCDFVIASNDKGKEIYKVSEAIPSGERVYLSGKASKYCYDLENTNVSGTIKIPVKINTTYILKWVDYKGVYHAESQTVQRNYYVSKKYSYYRVDKANVYKLRDIKLSSDALESEMLFKPDNDVNKYVEQYGASKNRITYKIDKAKCVTEDVVIFSSNNLRPSIPDDNYQKVANEAVSYIKVKNDYLSIEDNIVLNDEEVKNSGKAPVYKMPEKIDILEKDLFLSYESPNGEYVPKCELLYKNVTFNTSKKNVVATNKISIFTPVVCKISMLFTKNLNQEVNPVENTVILGKNVEMSENFSGFHSNLKGYGERDYSEYVGYKFIKLPISVYVEGNYYRKNEWIYLGWGNSTDLSLMNIQVPPSTKLGNYKGQYKCYVMNADGEEEEGGLGANTSINQSFAYVDFDFRVSGNVYKFGVEDGTQRYAVDKLVFSNQEGAGSENNSVRNYDSRTGDNCDELCYSYSMNVTGDYSNEDKIMISYIYYYLKDGKRIPVNVYTYSDGKLEKADDKKIIKTNNFKSAGVHEYSVKSQLEFKGKIYAFEKNIEIEGTSDLVRNYRDRLRDGSILVAFDITVYKDNKPYLSYINFENAKKGYCNMWKEEGFNYIQKLEAYEYEMFDGDALCIGGEIKQKNKYLVVGTH